MNYLNSINTLRKKWTYRPGESLRASDFSNFAISCSQLVRFYYCILCFIFYKDANLIMKMGDNAPLDALWPMILFWSPIVEGNGLLLASTLLPIALLTIIFPGSFIFRLACFFAFLMITAYKNSFGSINHGDHFMLYIAFGFLFLPNGNYSRQEFSRRQTLQMLYVFWLLQLLLLFCYSMSGLWKVIGFNKDLFDFDTLTLLVVNRSIENDGRYVLWQGFAATYPTFIQISHIVTVFVQLTSVIVFFRPHFYKAYGALLIFFHFGTSYLLGITFKYHVFAWAMFFILIPMAPKQSNFVLLVHSIPFFGRFFQWLFPIERVSEPIAHSKPAIIYDEECPFCSNYVAYMKLRSVIGDIDLINARENNHPLVKEVKKRNLDLNDGMVFVYKEKFHYASDAIYMITRLSKIDSLLSTYNHFMFSNKHIARITYPIYKFGRRVTLTLMGRNRIS